VTSSRRKREENCSGKGGGHHQEPYENTDFLVKNLTFF